ncbi:MULTISPECIES: hypothetical protein [unclassified Bradyrhizobium]|uniref:hypothetical protein n=1 Tax=unclassified Bradyrhizobium TaxID=2631580 RepID=UPI0028E356A1|nr:MULTISPECIES: hypothetical protein [unclassified Bradyrhizobium]
MPNQPFEIIVWVNAEAKHYLSEAGLGLALVRGQCEGGRNTLVCEVIAVANVLVDATTVTFESAFGIFAAPPSSAPITPFKVLRPVLRQVAQPGRIFQFDGTQFTALQNAPSSDMIGITYRPLAPTAQRIVVGLTEMVRSEEGGAWPPINAVVLGAKETVFFSLPGPLAYIFTQSGMSVGQVLGCNLFVPPTPLEYRTSTIVIGQPLALPLSDSRPNEVHFDVRSNTFVRGPYPTTLTTASIAVRDRHTRWEQYSVRRSGVTFLCSKESLPLTD